MKALITWLKGLFLHPKEENTDMSEALNTTGTAESTTQVQADAPVADTSTTAQPAATVADPVAEAKVGVQDFEAALAFVENGVAQLGEAAKDELKALAKKYL